MPTAPREGLRSHFNTFQPPALRRMTGNDPNSLPTVIVPRSHVPRIVSV